MARDNDPILPISPKSCLAILLSGCLAVVSGKFVSDALKEMKESNENKKSTETATLINNEVFKEVYVDYDKYIELIGGAIKESDMNNSSMEVYVAYQNMQDNGWISLGTEFNYATPAIEPTGNLGISIPTGEGVCRNQAFNLFKVFNALGYESGVVYGNLFGEEIDEEDNIHAVTYVKEDGHLYLYDPTNKTIFLRDVLGRYISIDDENCRFKPNIFIDQEFNPMSADSVFKYLKEDYGSIVTYDTRRSRAQAKVDELGYYYAIYEAKYLIPYEKKIVDDLDYYTEEVNRILKEHGESAVKLEFK